jgi:tRNA threonylcarbamoyladenosine biosynthesis protein TsaB
LGLFFAERPAAANTLERDRMHILAIETTGLAGSVAALDDANLLTAIDLPQDQGSSRALAPAIQRLLAEVGWRPKDVQLVGVVVGPGSFTGLRVGVTAAKAFAYAVGAEVLGLDTLEVLAAAAPPEVSRLSAAIDAQRGEVAAADFARTSDGPMALATPARLLPIESWWSSLPPGALVTGPVLRQLIDRLPSHLTAMSPDFWLPKASAAGRLAARLYAAGHRDDLWSLAPHYSRPSAAEERKAKAPPPQETPRV